MNPQITVLEHAFHFSLPDIPNEIVSRLSKLTFYGGGDVSTKDHINKFWCKCIKYNIMDLHILFMFFPFVFKGWIKYWFEAFPAHSIFTWFLFVDEVLDAFEIHNYDKLCEELKTLLIKKDLYSKIFFNKDQSCS